MRNVTQPIGERSEGTKPFATLKNNPLLYTPSRVYNHTHTHTAYCIKTIIHKHDRKASQWRGSKLRPRRPFKAAPFLNGPTKTVRSLLLADPNPRAPGRNGAFGQSVICNIYLSDNRKSAIRRNI